MVRHHAFWGEPTISRVSDRAFKGRGRRAVQRVERTNQISCWLDKMPQSLILLESAGFSERRLPRFLRVRALQFRLAVGDLNRKIDALIDQFAEAFEVREERLEVGHLFGPNIPGAAAHVVGVT